MSPPVTPPQLLPYLAGAHYGAWRESLRSSTRGLVLCFFALLCLVLHCFALVCFALLASYCFALLCFAWLCIALVCFALLHFASLCIALHCSASRECKQVGSASKSGECKQVGSLPAPFGSPRRVLWITPPAPLDRPAASWIAPPEPCDSQYELAPVVKKLRLSVRAGACSKEIATLSTSWRL
jgi:hypothetical protein